MWMMVWEYLGGKGYIQKFIESRTLELRGCYENEHSCIFRNIKEEWIRLPIEPDLEVIKLNKCVWLPATTKLKLMSQVLVQMERGLFRCQDLGEWWTPISKTIYSSCSSCGSYKDRENKAFFLYPIILLAFGVLGPYPFIVLAFGTQCKNFPCTNLAIWGNSPVLPDGLQ